MAEVRNHYQVLGVSRDAGTEEIRAAHRRLVRVLHPDRHVLASPAEQQLAERRMREINDAWQTLKDPGKRSSYDLTLRGSTTTGSTGNRTTSPNRATAQRPSQGSQPRSASSNGSARSPNSAPGRGAYWSTASNGGQAQPPRHTRPAASNDADEGQEVSAGVYFLLKRGPIVAIVAVVLGLFVVTAFIGGRDEGETTAVIPESLGACVVLDDDSSDGYLVDCAQPNDGEVVALVEQPLDCPEETRFVQVGTEFVCIPTPLGG